MITKLPNSPKTLPAFTLTEIILVVAMITIIAGAGVAVGLQAFNAQQLTANRDLFTSSLYQAQSYARSGVNESDWGVHITSSNQLYIFSGSSFAGRDQTEDIIFNLSNNISITGSTTIVFSRVSGIPASTANFTLSQADNSLGIAINDVGTIDT